jgi:hypothetical protein
MYVGKLIHVFNLFTGNPENIQCFIIVAATLISNTVRFFVSATANCFISQAEKNHHSKPTEIQIASGTNKPTA